MGERFFYQFETFKDSNLWVFDFDGTLVDSMGFATRILNQALEPFDVAVDDELFEKIRSNHPERILEGILPPRDAQSAMDKMEELFKEQWSSTKVYDGIFDLLEYLKTQGKDLAVWTGRDLATASFLLEGHGLKPYFQCVVSGSCVSNNKPSSDGILKVLKETGVSNKNAFHVGDHWHDVHGAKEVGVHPVLATWAAEPAFPIPWDDVLHFECPKDLLAWSKRHS